MYMITVIGCGWLGLPLAEELVKQGHRVAGSVRNPTKLKALKSLGIEGFVYNSEDNTPIPEEIAAGTEYLVITLPPQKREEPKYYGELLAGIVRQFKRVKHVIFTSSTGVYPQCSGTYYEDFAFLEIEKEKNVLFHAEQAIQAATKSTLCILRLAGLFGGGRHPVHQLAGRLDVKNPSGNVNLVHRSDVIRCIGMCIGNPHANGIFNVVYPEHPWRKDYYTKLYRQHDLPAIGFIPSQTIERRIPSDKIMKTLDFRFQHSINNLHDLL